MNFPKPNLNKAWGQFRFLGALGAAAIGGLASLANIFGLFYRLLTLGLVGMTRYRLIRREFARQIYLIGGRGWPIVALTGMLLGLAIIVYASAQLAKIGGEQFVGNLLVIIVIRELGPVLTALLVLLRSGAAMIVEIGAMVLDREIEALELMGLEPEIVIGGPRFWGLVISLITLYFIFVVCAIWGGFLFSQIFADMYWGVFWLSFVNALGWPDLVLNFAKVVLFGMFIGVVAIYHGLQTADHWESIVAQTSRGAVISLLFLGLINTALSVLYNV